jgi:uncharacterized RDD family membrane protein YckC
MTDGVLTSTGITLGYASRSSRLLGQMVDGFVAAAPALGASLILSVSGVLGGVGLALGFVWGVYYHFFADALHDGQSFGKQWLGMRVVDAATGAPCRAGQSFIRNLLTVLGPLDWIFIFGERHQRLGDKAAGTVVVIAD